MDREQYDAWWRDNTDADGEVLSVLPEPLATLAAHVQALQGRVDDLMDPDDHIAQHNADRRPGGCPCRLVQCACAYDHPDDVCMVHQGATVNGS